MEKIKKTIQKMSLRKSLALILASILILVTIFSTAAILSTSNLRQDILNTRAIKIDTDQSEFYLKQDRYSVYYQLNPKSISYESLTGKNLFLYYLATVLMVALPVLFILLGAFFATKLYYRLKLRAPIEALEEGISHISDCDLDFQISYQSKDELGMLCDAFESMRQELCRNNQKMWEMLRERRALTASVSHDLRTPITVLKGYLEYLGKNGSKISSETLSATVQSMTRSTERLERYVSCIRDIQKMEDIDLFQSKVGISELVQEIREEFQLLAEEYGKTLEIRDKVELECLQTDRELLFKILENIMGNAFRFAKTRIVLTIEEKENYLEFVIEDDGIGFSKEDLERATSLFYTSKINHGEYGIGLSICKVLCDKLDGRLKICNGPDGGGCVIVQIQKH